MDYRAKTLLDARRENLERTLGRKLTVPPPSDRPDLSESEREHLLSDATDLYENELAWEDITDEEQIEGGPLSELTFPGFLAYIRGLLLDQVMPDSLAPANPRPEVVEQVLHFLAETVVALQERSGASDGTTDGDDDHRTARDLALTDRLLDLVLFQLHTVDPADVEGFRDGAAAS